MQKFVRSIFQRIGVERLIVNQSFRASKVAGLCTAISLLGSTPLWAQPANDNPCGAIALTVSNVCNPLSTNNNLATATAGVVDPGCASYAGGDVWFTVTMPNATLTLTAGAGTLTDMGMAIYTAPSCAGTFTLRLCDDDSGAGFMPQITRTTAQIAAGTILYVRLWNFGGGTGTFDICATAPIPPSNDNPCGATPLTAAGTCTYTTGSNALSTATAGVPAPGCANYVGGDVWYSLTMPAATLTLDMNTGTLTDMGMAVYTAATCAGPFTLISCDDDSSPNGFMPLLNITNGQVAAGTNVFVRVWDYDGDATGTFGICATAVVAPTPPANDNPCGAVSLTAAGTCTYLNGTNVNATATVGVPAPGCASYGGGDVWYSLSMPATTLTVDMNTGTLTDMGMAIYSAATCAGPFTLIACDDDSSPNGFMPLLDITTAQAAPGTNLFIRVWDFGGNATGTFGICATAVAPPVTPANDDPCGAITLTSAVNCNYLAGTNVNATNTNQPGDPGCAFYSGEDVWYQVTMSATDLTLDMLEGSLTDMGMAVYTGNNCNAGGSFSLLACDDDNSPNGLMPQILITTAQVAAGATLYVRVWNFGGGTGTFSICATEAVPVNNNDDPCGAITLTESATCNYTFYDNLNATTTITPGDPGCAFFVDGDVWFTMAMPNSDLLLDMIEGGLTDMGMAVYTAGSCGGPFTLIDCDDDSSPNGLMPQIQVTLAQVVPGTQLYIRVWNFGGGAFGDFGICAQTNAVVNACGTLPDNCALACDLGILPAPPSCNGGGGILTGAPVSNFLTNEGATAENPYQSILSCGGIPGNDMASPATDVWYTFQATGTILNVDIQSSIANPLNTPNIGIYLGNACGALTPVFCGIGGGGSLTESFSPMYPGQTYYIQISGGDPLDQGDFTLTLQNDLNCDNCLISATLTANPPPVNGVYQAGQTVTFCFQLTEYNQTAANWIHGVVVEPGAGWDLGTLTPLTAPASCDFNPGANWAWHNSVTGSVTGNTYGPGFFYETNMGSNCSCFNGNPGDNYGDPDAGLVGCFPTFCWQITTPTAGGCVDAADLSMTVNTTGDYESGSWFSQGCGSDPNYVALATLSCCMNPLIASSDASCGVNNGTATATGQGTGPWDYVWEDAGGNILGSVTNQNGPFSITGLAPAQYFVTVTDAINCVTTGVATVAQVNTLTPVAANNGPVCLGQTLVLTETTIAGATYQWSGPNGYSGSGQSVSIPNVALVNLGTYTVTADLGGGCTGSATTTVTQAANPVITAVSTIPCVGQSIQLSAQGADNYSWTGPLGYSATGAAPDRDNATLAMAGVYTVVGTTTAGCSSSTTVNVTVNSCVEVCGNGVDDDADGQIDTDDPDCPCGN